MLDLLNKNKRKIVLILIFIMIFTMSYYCPFDADDFNYSHIPWTTEKITGLKSIIKSQIIMYKLWSGRVLFSGLGQLFLFTNKFVYAFFNACAFIALLTVIINFFNQKKSQKLILLIVAFFCIWHFSNPFVEDIIWLSGSVNYLWPVLFSCCFISLFYKTFISKKQKRNLGLLIPLALITGISHEITIFVTGSFLLFYLLFNFKDVLKDMKEKNFSEVITIITFGLGALICLFAPGNMSRSNHSLIFNIRPLIYNFFQIKYLIILVLLCLIYHFFQDKKEWKREVQYIILPSILSLIPMTVITEFPPRVILIYIVLFTIIVIDTLNQVVNKINVFQGGYNFIEIILTLIVLYQPLVVTNYYSTKVKDYNEEIERAVQHSQNTKDKDVVINQLEIPSKLIEKYVIGYRHRASVFKNSIYSLYFCNYYGCDSVVAKNKDNIIVTIKSSSEVKIKTEEKIYTRIEPYTQISEEANATTYVFEIPSKYEKTFEVVTNDRKSIDTIEIVDINYKETYDIKNFNRFSIK